MTFNSLEIHEKIVFMWKTILQTLETQPFITTLAYPTTNCPWVISYWCIHKYMQNETNQ